MVVANPQSQKIRNTKETDGRIHVTIEVGDAPTTRERRRGPIDPRLWRHSASARGYLILTVAPVDGERRDGHRHGAHDRPSTGRSDHHSNCGCFFVDNRIGCSGRSCGGQGSGDLAADQIRTPGVDSRRLPRSRTAC